MTKILPVSRFTVNGNSMLPTLKPGQDILSFNWAYLEKRPKSGDIVVITVNSERRTENREIVKRVVKVEGEKLWVEGDNKRWSSDSRDFGSVGMKNVVGRVIYSSPVISNKVRDLETSKSRDFSLVARNDVIDCPKCGSKVLGIYGRKDAICKNCGFKLSCCGEP